jgi:hypothetical protein
MVEGCRPGNCGVPGLKESLTRIDAHRGGRLARWTLVALDVGRCGRWSLWTLVAVDASRYGRWSLWTLVAVDAGRCGTIGFGALDRLCGVPFVASPSRFTLTIRFSISSGQTVASSSSSPLCYSSTSPQHRVEVPAHRWEYCYTRLHNRLPVFARPRFFSPPPAQGAPANGSVQYQVPCHEFQAFCVKTINSQVCITEYFAHKPHHIVKINTDLDNFYATFHKSLLSLR